MRTLANVAYRPSAKNDPLPSVFPALAAIGAIPRRACVTMIAATPSSMKTFAVLKWVQAMKLPTLFFSADTDDLTVTERMAAILTGDRQTEIRDAFRYGGEEMYAKKLADESSHLRFCFESDPSYDDIVLETAAFAEAFGTFPEVIVVDNLVNVVPDSDDEWGGMRETAKVLHRLVRVTGAAVFVLHHMSESTKNPLVPSPRKDIQGKVAQLPELIYSLAREGPEMRWAVVKNRHGEMDATGEKYVTIWVDPETGQFYNGRHEMEMGLAL